MASDESTARKWPKSLVFLIGFVNLSMPCVNGKADFHFSNVTLTKLTFGSCHKSKYENPHIWQRVQEQDSQAWIWLGDAVYPPMRKIAPVQVLRNEYESLKKNSGYAKLLETTPFILGTWDDHDFGANDMGNRMPNIAERRDAFFDFIGTRPESVDRDGRLGVYHSATFGEPPNQVKIILLDTRTYRDDHCLPSVATSFPLGAGVACVTRWIAAGLLPEYCKRRQGTVLGEEQWAWLENELKESTAALHLIFSSVQVLSTNPVMEGWCHFPSERDRLLRLLRGVRGVVLLSGDVHYAEILDGPGGLSESTSSGLTHVCTKHIYGPLCKPLLYAFNAHRSDKEAFHIGLNFGSILIDWPEKTVQVKIHDALTGDDVLQTGLLPVVDQMLFFSEDDLQQVPTCMNGHLVPIAVAIMAGFATLLLVWRYL